MPGTAQKPRRLQLPSLQVGLCDLMLVLIPRLPVFSKISVRAIGSFTNQENSQQPEAQPLSPPGAAPGCPW